MRRIFTAILVLAMVTCFFAGCQNPFTNLPDDTYFVNYGSDSLNYKLYVNKQTTIILNHLSTHMTLAIKVTDESKATTITSAEQSLSEMKAAKEVVEKLCPPAEYDSSHKQTLLLYANAIGNIEDFICELKEETLDRSKLSDLTSLMQTNFLALTSEFNQYVI